MAKLLACILVACMAWGFLSDEQIEQMNTTSVLDSQVRSLDADSQAELMGRLNGEIDIQEEDLSPLDSSRREIASVPSGIETWNSFFDEINKPRKESANNDYEIAWLTYRMKIYEQMGLTESEINKLIELDDVFAKARDEIVDLGAQESHDAKRKKSWDQILAKLEDEYRNQQMGVVGKKRYRILLHSLAQFRQVYVDLTGEAPRGNW